MPRVLLFATHPSSSNGYSKVAYELANFIAQKPNIQLTYYGFQNFQRNANHDKERKLPDNVQVYDAYANEKQRGLGFGFDEVTEFVTMNKPDVCIIYNDMVVISNIVDKLKAVENRKFKIIAYVDQVYLCQKKEFITRLNNDVDYVICFSKFWEDCIKGQGLTVPTGILEHGFNPTMHFPVPKKIARLYFNLKQDDFIVINANRNQPRKRLDIMMMAFAEVVSHHMGEPIKLLIATAPTGAWNLMEIYERELKLRGVTLEEGLKHIIFIDNPQALTDEDMNILFNTADVGINTAMGEGWGLCNFEAGAIGIPQIVPAIGGFHDFFDHHNAQLIQPKIKLYTDMTIDGCPGCAEVCDSADFAEAIERYYADETLRKQHGDAARKRILTNYRWKDLGAKLYTHICKVAGVEEVETPIAIAPTPSPVESTQEVSSNEVALEDINRLLDEKLKEENDSSIPNEVAPPPPSVQVPETPTTKPQIRKITNIKDRLRAKLAQKQEASKKVESELEDLKSKLNQLLQKS